MPARPPSSHRTSPGSSAPRWIATAALLVALASPLLLRAQDPGAPARPTPAQPALPPAGAAAPAGARPPGPPPGFFGPPPGDRLFAQSCASCHGEQGVEVNGRTAPALATLKSMTAEAIYDAMVSGKMQVQAAA